MVVWIIQIKPSPPPHAHLSSLSGLVLQAQMRKMRVMTHCFDTGRNSGGSHICGVTCSLISSTTSAYSQNRWDLIDSLHRSESSKYAVQFSILIHDTELVFHGCKVMSLSGAWDPHRHGLRCSPPSLRCVPCAQSALWGVEERMGHQGDQHRRVSSSQACPLPQRLHTQRHTGEKSSAPTVPPINHVSHGAFT